MERKRPILLYISVSTFHFEKDGKTVLVCGIESDLRVLSWKCTVLYPCHRWQLPHTASRDPNQSYCSADWEVKVYCSWEEEEAPYKRNKFKEPSEMVGPLYSEGKKGGCQPLPTEYLWLRTAQMLMAKLAGSSEKWQIIVSELMASLIFVWTRGSWKLIEQQTGHCSVESQLEY